MIRDPLAVLYLDAEALDLLPGRLVALKGALVV
jgi:hypothetical protein